MTPRDYCALDPADRPAAFTVAGIRSVALIEMLQREILSNLCDGSIFRDFYSASLVHFARALERPPSRWRLEVLYRTTTAQSYAAGHAAGMVHPDVRLALPWWWYSTVGDSRVRRSHQALNGFVARWDDPVWRMILPPNGPCCRCKVRAYTTQEAAQLVGESTLRIPGVERLPTNLRIQYPVSVLPFILGERPFLRR